MATVVKRTFKSIPERNADQTWTSIIDLLTQGKNNNVKDELIAVTGIAASIIADQAPKGAAIIVTCDGPRTRIYCLYDENAIEGSDANEDVLGFDPLKGDWHISLPCLAENLIWVKNALSKHSTRITARSSDDAFSITEEDSESNKSQSLTLNPKGFLGL